MRPRKTAAPPPEPLTAALALLAIRSLTRSELREKLVRKGLAEVAVDQAIEELERRRLLPKDTTVLRAFGETRGARRGWGRVRLEQELRKRGAVGRDASTIAAELVSPDVERQRLAEQVERSAARMEKSPASTARLAGRLARAGFAAGEIREALLRAGFRLVDSDAERPAPSSRRSSLRRKSQR